MPLITFIYNGLVWNLWSLGMHHNYQQIDLQTLIDLLAEETQKYTKAYISGNPRDVDQQKAIIDALVQEINIRKQRGVSNVDQGSFQHGI